MDVPVWSLFGVIEPVFGPIVPLFGPTVPLLWPVAGSLVADVCGFVAVVMPLSLGLAGGVIVPLFIGGDIEPGADGIVVPIPALPCIWPFCIWPFCIVLPEVAGVPATPPCAMASCCSLRRRVAARASLVRRDDTALLLVLFCTIVFFDCGAALAVPVARPRPIATARMVLVFMPISPVMSRPVAE